jgi:hypothetical protein
MTFTSIDLLKASTPLSGEIYDVLGYYTPGDGGGGSFYWDAGSTAIPESGMIVASNSFTTGRWMRLYSSPVNIRWFGAKSEVNFDNAPAIQAAINYCSRPWLDPADPIGTRWAWISPIQLTSIYVPKGIFEVHQTIILNPYTKIFGDSSPSTITTENQGAVLQAVSFTGYMFDTANLRFSDLTRQQSLYLTQGSDLDNLDYAYVTNIEFDSITFLKKNTTPGVHNFMGYLKLSGATNSRITHCMFRYGNFPIVINCSWDWVIEDCFIQPEICGIVLYRAITQGVVTRTEVAGHYIKSSFEAGLPFGFSTPGNINYGKACGIYQEQSNARLQHCVIEFGFPTAIISNFAAGTIDDIYIEGIVETAYMHISCPNLDYRLGYTVISVPLFNLSGFSKGNIYFNGLQDSIASLGTVDPSSTMKVFNILCHNLVLPKGMEQGDDYAQSVSGDIYSVLKSQLNKKLTATGAISHGTDDINLSGKLVLKSGINGQTAFSVSKHVFYFGYELEFENLNITLTTGLAEWISFISGYATVKFNNCNITLASGQHLFGNLAATRSYVKIYFKDCVVTSASPTALFNTMIAAYQGLDVEVYNIRSTFTNITVQSQSPLLEIKYKNF